MQIPFHGARAIALLQSAAHYRAASPGCQIERARWGNVALALTMRRLIAAGLVPPDPLLDLRIDENLRADMDMNISMNRDGHFIEVQGTAERQPFDRTMLDRLFDGTAYGIRELRRLQGLELE
jgi:ribonuclease PH